MTPSYKILHKNFKFNSLSYSREELKGIGYGFVKEGEKYEQSIGSFLQDWFDESETIKVRTSGSTGEPQQILLKKEHMVNSALATGDFFDLKLGSTALLCLSSDFIVGKMMLVRAMVLGLELDYVEPSSNPLANITKSYDFCAMVPLQLENSLEKIDRIKTLIVGGAPISNTLKEKIQNTNCEVFETYGMTETVTHVAVKKINDIRLSPSTALRAGSAEISFKALPNLKFSIDERNCLIIDALKISDKPVITNDVVNLISETEFEWLGRYDNVINSGGVKLFPEQIEAKLSKIIANRFFVAGFPDEKLGQKLVLILEGKGEVGLLQNKLIAATSLDKYEIPKEIRYLSKFKITGNGKIQREETVNLLK